MPQKGQLATIQVWELPPVAPEIGSRTIIIHVRHWIELENSLCKNVFVQGYQNNRPSEKNRKLNEPPEINGGDVRDIVRKIMAMTPDIPTRNR